MRSLIAFIPVIFLGVLPAKAATSHRADQRARARQWRACDYFARSRGQQSHSSNVECRVGSKYAAYRRAPDSDLQRPGRGRSNDRWSRDFFGQHSIAGRFRAHLRAQSERCLRDNFSDRVLVDPDQSCRGPGSGFVLDGLSGVSAAPEPSVWEWMLVGFEAAAWRLKRRRQLVLAAAI